jgi:3-oxoacyl-[acyl-carrier-protein] synthase-3
MGALLEAVATSTLTQWGQERPSSTRLAIRAATEALRRAGRDAGDVELLVNAGVFRDDNVFEPANAAFVQHGIGANLEWSAGGGPGTLAFDLLNGACGVLSAAQVVDGFLTTGGGCGMVVTSDVEPKPGRSSGFGYLPFGGALLLRGGQPDEGFQAFDQQTYAEHARLSEAFGTWSPQGHVVHVREQPDFAARGLECAADAVLRFLDKQGRDAADIDLVVGWPFPDRLPAVLRERVGFERDQILDLTAVSGFPAGPLYTAGIAVAIEAATTTPRYRDARHVLLLAVSGGITVVSALYRKQPGQL